jgi:hypothetical protein
VNITIGQGPDFVMKRGKVELFHTLQIKWYLASENVSKNEVISDRSIFVVTNLFSAKLLIFENINLISEHFEEDSIAFEYFDGVVKCVCFVLLNSMHRIPTRYRSNIESFFVQSMKCRIEKLL